MLEFKKPIPVVVEGDKEGYAIYVSNSGTFENDVWAVVLSESGQVRHYTSDQVKIWANATFGIKKEEPKPQVEKQESSYEQDPVSGTKSTEDMIREVMEEFDFQKVQRTMEALNWKWFTTGGRVPNIYELKSSAEKYLKETVKELLETHTLKLVYSTGGFSITARKSKADGGLVDLLMEFVLTEGSSYNYTD